MEEHADPAYSEVKMQLAAEKRAEQRHASPQVVSVPEVKASDQNGQKADSGEASTAEPMQNESKDDSGQPPQQQTENNTRETEATVPDSGSKDDAKHESPSQKDASTKADASNPDEKVKALSTAAGPPKPADKPATEDPGKKKAEEKAKAAPKVLPKVAAKAESSEKKRKAEEVKDTGKGKGKKKTKWKKVKRENCQTHGSQILNDFLRPMNSKTCNKERTPRVCPAGALPQDCLRWQHSPSSKMPASSVPNFSYVRMVAGVCWWSSSWCF